jgi:hypothetical protein
MESLQRKAAMVKLVCPACGVTITKLEGMSKHAARCCPDILPPRAVQQVGSAAVATLPLPCSHRLLPGPDVHSNAQHPAVVRSVLRPQTMAHCSSSWETLPQQSSGYGAGP